MNSIHYGVLLRKREGDAITEYPVDPGQIALALAAKVTFDTGLLSEDTLLVRQDGVKRLVVEYRRPQKTGIYLEGSDAPLRVPLPPLLLIRTTTEDKNPAVPGLRGESTPDHAGHTAVSRPAAECLQLRQHLLGQRAARG